jgi:hypothetical protein
LLHIVPGWKLEEFPLRKTLSTLAGSLKASLLAKKGTAFCRALFRPNSVSDL